MFYCFGLIILCKMELNVSIQVTSMWLAAAFRLQMHNRR